MAHPCYQVASSVVCLLRFPPKNMEPRTACLERLDTPVSAAQINLSLHSCLCFSSPLAAFRRGLHRPQAGNPLRKIMVCNLVVPARATANLIKSDEFENGFGQHARCKEMRNRACGSLQPPKPKPKASEGQHKKSDPR